MILKKTVAVIGLGYVGLPLAIAFSKHFKVIGYDINQVRIAELNESSDSLNIVFSKQLSDSNITFTDSSETLSEADFYIIAVQTPINENREPDLTPLLSATETIGKVLNKGDIVVYEATVYPGLTEEECIPLLEGISLLECGVDFFVGYSPERINPGDEKRTLENTIKLVSACNKNTLKIISEMYSKVVNAELYQVESIKVAEAAKVIENTQRDINIALMNELSLIFNRIGVDTHDVIDAAATKWNFAKYTPGLVGGHCIGVDPYYLTHKSLKAGYSPQVILSGRNVNDSMGFYIARTVIKELIKRKSINRTTLITILGFSFKENISDIRNTKVFDILSELLSYQVNVQIHDPNVNKTDAFGEYNIELTDYDDLKLADVLILAVAHKQFIDNGWKFIEALSKEDAIIFDVKSVLSRNEKPENFKLIRL